MYAEIFCLLCIALRLCSSKVHILHGLVYTLHNSIWPDFVFGTHRLVTPPATTTPEMSYMNVCINEYFCLKLMKKATLFQAFGTTEGARLLYWWYSNLAQIDWFNCKECFDILRFKVDWYAHFSVQKCGLHGLQKRSSLLLVPLWLQYERLTKQCCILLLKKWQSESTALVHLLVWLNSPWLRSQQMSVLGFYYYYLHLFIVFIWIAVLIYAVAHFPHLSQ